MVVKRQCSFCSGEIEPGTGTMFVKRDGTVFHFCSSSCRKQQLHLGRVGHRFKWTRAHALKRAADMRSTASASAAGTRPSAKTTTPAGPTPAASPKPEPKSAPAAKAKSAPAPAEKGAAKEPTSAPKKPKSGTPKSSGASGDAADKSS